MLAFLSSQKFVRFAHDLANRPTLRIHEFADATITVTNSFDDAGLLAAQDISDPRFFPRVGVEEGAYNANDLNQYGDISGVNLSHDLNGNLLGNETAIYAYDALNRLVAAQTARNATYLYDALDRRAAKVVDGQETWFQYDGFRAVGEYDNLGDETRRYVYGAWIDEPVSMEVAGERYFYHHDRLGTVTALANATGGLAESYRYTPFGAVETPSALGNPYLFTGRRYDAETGLLYYRARMFDPRLGRFMQVDPIDVAGGVNLYRYVGNGVTIWVDPYGLVNWGAVVAGGSAMIEGGFYVGGGITALPSVVGTPASVSGIIYGTGLFSWGVAEVIAGFLDSHLPVPNPSLPFFLTQLITGDLEFANDVHAGVDMISDIISAISTDLNMMTGIDVIENVNQQIGNYPSLLPELTNSPPDTLK